VPEELIEELKKDKEKTKSGQTGVEIAIRTVNEIKDCCQGVHLMALGWEDKVPAILDGIGQ
jgi:5,10-methylenetetrahydrofolate reductase